METKYIKEFIELSKTMNFGLTASKLFISQSSLSKHIRTLEDELGAPLFIRNSRQVQLSDFGKFFLPKAVMLFSLYYDIDISINDYLNKTNKHFCLGLIENMQTYMIDLLLRDFKKAYPDYSFTFYEGTNNDLEAKYNSGDFNIFSTCIVGKPDSSYEFLSRATSEIVVYINCLNKLSKNEYLSIEDLRNEQLFVPSKGTRFLSMIDDAFKAKGFELHAPFHGSFDTAKTFTEANIGISILPKHCVMGPIPDTVKIIPLVPKIEYTLGFAYRKNNLSTAEKLFVDFLKANKDYEFK